MPVAVTRDRDALQLPFGHTGRARTARSNLAAIFTRRRTGLSGAHPIHTDWIAIFVKEAALPARRATPTRRGALGTDARPADGLAVRIAAIVSGAAGLTVRSARRPGLLTEALRADQVDTAAQRLAGDAEVRALRREENAGAGCALAGCPLAAQQVTVDAGIARSKALALRAAWHDPGTERADPAGNQSQQAPGSRPGPVPGALCRWAGLSNDRAGDTDRA
jgi:hypothetical protein